MCIRGPRRVVSVVVKIVASGLDSPSGRLRAVTVGKPLDLCGLSFHLLRNSHPRHINAQPGCKRHSASHHEVLLCEAGVGPGFGPASRLDCLPQVPPWEDSPAPRAWGSGEQMAPGRSRVALQPGGRPDGRKDPFASSWLSLKQGDTGGPQPLRREGSVTDEPACPLSSPSPAAEPADNLITVIPAAWTHRRQTRTSSPPLLES